MKCILCESENHSEYSALGYLQCAECGLVWMMEDHWPSAAREEERYLEHKNSLAEPGYISYLTQTAEPLRALLTPGARGLDFGCGPVEGMKRVLPEFSVDSYDPIFFPEPKLLNNHYDFVICCEAAEHFFSPRTEFSTFAKIIQGGGFLLVRSLLVVPPEEFSQWHYRRDPTHVCFYSEKTVQWIARKFGFELLRLSSPHWLLKKILA